MKEAALREAGWDLRGKKRHESAHGRRYGNKIMQIQKAIKWNGGRNEEEV